MKSENMDEKFFMEGRDAKLEKDTSGISPAGKTPEAAKGERKEHFSTLL
jgi:hypothetical protein